MDGVVPGLGILILMFLVGAILAIAGLVIALVWIWRRNRRYGISAILVLIGALTIPPIINMISNWNLQRQLADLTILPDDIDLENSMIFYTDTYYPGPRCQHTCVEFSKITDHYAVHVTGAEVQRYHGEINLLDFDRRAQRTYTEVEPIIDVASYHYVLLSTNTKDMAVIDPERWYKYRNRFMRILVMYPVHDQESFDISKVQPTMQIVTMYLDGPSIVASPLRMEMGYETPAVHDVLERWVDGIVASRQHQS